MKYTTPKSVNWNTIRNYFTIFIALNILTIPLSPIAGGLMSKEAYTPIMYAKLSIIGIFIIWSVVLLVKHIMFLLKNK